MIEVNNLSKRFANAEVLKGISFGVKAGEICAIAGIEGAGKTTLADLLAGSIEADGGQILICGMDMEKKGGAARQHVGYAAAQPMLYRDMTPRAGMKFVAEARGMGSREAGDKVSAAIKKFGIKDISDTVVTNLSEGARRLVSIAQASFTGAEVIIVDEPTAGLNPKEILEVREALLKLKADHAVLLMSRSLTEMCAVADRVLVMHEGRIVAESTPEVLHRQTMDDGTLCVAVRGEESVVRAALASAGGAKLTEIKEENGVCKAVLSANGQNVREAVFKAACEKGLVLLEMTHGRRKLDELLRQLVSEKVILRKDEEVQGDEGSL